MVNDSCKDIETLISLKMILELPFLLADNNKNEFLELFWKDKQKIILFLYVVLVNFKMFKFLFYFSIYFLIKKL